MINIKFLSIIITLIHFSLSISLQCMDKSEYIKRVFSENVEELRSVIPFTFAINFINEDNEDGDTPLINAASKNLIEIVRILLAAGANVDIKNKYGNTALMVAEDKKYFEIVNLIKEALKRKKKKYFQDLALLGPSSIESVKFAIDNLDDINFKNERGQTPLMAALSWCSGSKKLVQLFIDANADLNIQDEEGRTALMVACSGVTYNDEGVILDYVNMIGNLIKAKTNLDIQDNEGNTALILAVKCNYKEVVPLLLSAGAAICIKNKNRETALSIAQKEGFVEIIKLLEERIGTLNEFLSSVKDGSALETDKGNNINFEINFQDEFGLSALMRAAQGATKKPLLYAKEKILIFLLDRGANTEIKDMMGQTALHWAAQNGHLNLVKILVNYGADKNAQDKWGKKPGELALKFGYSQIANYLN